MWLLKRSSNLDNPTEEEFKKAKEITDRYYSIKEEQRKEIEDCNVQQMVGKWYKHGSEPTQKYVSYTKLISIDSEKRKFNAFKISISWNGFPSLTVNTYPVDFYITELYAKGRWESHDTQEIKESIALTEIFGWMKKMMDVEQGVVI